MINVEITSPEGIIYEGKSHMVVVPSTGGDVGVMQGHEAMVANLREGKIAIYNEKQEIEKEIDVTGGFMEVFDGQKLLVLVD